MVIAASAQDGTVGLAMPEPGVHVAGTEDVDAAELAHWLTVHEHDERPRGLAVAAGGRKENHQWCVCVCSRERLCEHSSLSLFRVIMIKKHRSS